MPVVTGAFSQLLVPGLRKIFFQHLNERESEYGKIFNEETSSRAFEEDLELIGLGTMPAKSEGSAITYQDTRQGEKVRFTHVTYGYGFRVTREMMQDDQYGQIRKMPKELAKGGRNVREVTAFNVINNGFTTSFGFPKNGTNEAVFNTAHTRLGGGTLANRPTTDADLGQASLEAAIITFQTWTDEMGIPVVITPKWLLIHPDNMMVARELLGSTYKPYVGTNEINPLMKDGLEFIVGHYLTDSDAWFLFADKSDHGFTFFQREAMQFQNGDDFDTGDAKYKAFQRFSVGVNEWRGSYGTVGA